MVTLVALGGGAQRTSCLGTPDLGLQSGGSVHRGGHLAVEAGVCGGVLTVSPRGCVPSAQRLFPAFASGRVRMGLCLRSVCVYWAPPVYKSLGAGWRALRVPGLPCLASWLLGRAWALLSLACGCVSVTLTHVVLPHEPEKNRCGRIFPPVHKTCLRLNPLAQPGGVPGSGLLGTWAPQDTGQRWACTGALLGALSPGWSHQISQPGESTSDFRPVADERVAEPTRLSHCERDTSFSLRALGGLIGHFLCAQG